MPVVDLSRIGLEGIESAHRVFESQARVRQQDQAIQSAQVSDAEKMFELSQAQRKQAIADEIAASIPNIASGGRGRLSPDESSPGATMDSLADPLIAAGSAFMRGGAPEAGMEFLKTASEVKKREADMANDQIKARGDQLDNMIKGADLVSAQVGTAQTPEEWDRGWQVVEESGLVPQNLIDMFKEQGFSHDMVALVNEQAMGAKERADLDRQANAELRNQRNTESAIAYRDQMLEISRGRLREQQKTRERLEKQGKSSTVPSTSAVAGARTAIITDVFNGEDPGKDHPGIQAGAYAIASRANQMLQENKALDWDTAMARAIEESKAAGDWEPWVNIQKFLGLEVGRSPAPARYKPAGKTEKTALPLPMVDGAVDPSRLVKGRYYIINGEPKKFTGE